MNQKEEHRNQHQKTHLKKKKLPFPNMLCQMLVWFLDSNEHFGLSIGPSEAFVSEDICSAKHDLQQDVQGERIVKMFPLMDIQDKYLISHTIFSY